MNLDKPSSLGHANVFPLVSCGNAKTANPDHLSDSKHQIVWHASRCWIKHSGLGLLLLVTYVKQKALGVTGFVYEHGVWVYFLVCVDLKLLVLFLPNRLPTRTRCWQSSWTKPQQISWVFLFKPHQSIHFPNFQSNLKPEWKGRMLIFACG